MKIPSSPATTIRELRHDRGLAVHALATLVGMMPSRLSEYEQGARPIPESQLRKICQALGVPFEQFVSRTAWTPVPRGRPHRPFEALALEQFSPDKPFFPERTRDLSFRLRGAWKLAPERVTHLQAALGRREDAAGLATFLRDFPADSSLEALFDLEIVALGAGPAMLSPARLGFQALAIIDPRSRSCVGPRRRPALVLPVGAASIVFIPQVGVRLVGMDPILDFLVGVGFRGWSSWSVVEIDGPRHLAEQDRKRDEALGLPVLRLDTRDLLDPGMSEVLMDWLFRQHEQQEPGRGRKVGRTGR